MNTRKPYWEKHPQYRHHYPLAEINHESGKWELFRVVYEPSLDYVGGDYHEIYWQGDLQHDDKLEMGERVTNPKEMLEQFIDFWLDENRG